MSKPSRFPSEFIRSDILLVLARCEAERPGEIRRAYNKNENHKGPSNVRVMLRQYGYYDAKPPEYLGPTIKFWLENNGDGYEPKKTP